MTCLAHISDLHFGRDLQSVAEGLLHSLERIEPESILISGDLTQRARRGEFQGVARFLRRLPRPFLIVPGNHDLSGHNLLERFFFPWDKWRKHVSHELEPAGSGDGFTVVGVNTARRMGLYLDWSRGRINHQQIDQVAKLFSAAPAHHLRIVLAHHPFWLPQSSPSRSLVGRRDAALCAFKRASIDLVLGGHIHLAYVESVNGIIVSHAGTTISHRLIDGQPNSFNLVRGDRVGLKVERWEWGGRNFEQVSCEEFHRAKCGWQPH